MKKFIRRHVLCMNQVCGVNRTSFGVGQVLIGCGLAMTAIGYALVTIPVMKFDPNTAYDYEMAIDFVDACLA